MPVIKMYMTPLYIVYNTILITSYHSRTIMIKVSITFN